jgi:Sulfotransferase family
MRRDGAMPTFFIIGAPKTGTTSFHHYLEQHPQIQMSSVKEPTFFAPSPEPGEESRSINRLDRYERLFDPSVPVRGEASTAYAEYPFRQGVPEKIKQAVPDARFIYLVRDPIERTLSHYNHFVASEGERRSLRELLADLSDPRLPCICASLYALQLDLYLRHFSREQILVVDQAELLSDRRATLRAVFEFLGVDREFDSPRFDDELFRASERRTYPPRLARFVGISVRPRARWVPQSARRRVRIAVERLMLPSLDVARLDDEMRETLSEFYASETQRLRELTGREFLSWSV